MKFKFFSSQQIRFHFFSASTFNSHYFFFCKFDAAEKLSKNPLYNDYPVPGILCKPTKVFGRDCHPLWRYLLSKAGNITDKRFSQYFTLFICDKYGVPRVRHAPSVDPREVESDVQHLMDGAIDLPQVSLPERAFTKTEMNKLEKIRLNQLEARLQLRLGE